MIRKHVNFYWIESARFQLKRVLYFSLFLLCQRTLPLNYCYFYFSNTFSSSLSENLDTSSSSSSSLIFLHSHSHSRSNFLLQIFNPIIHMAAFSFYLHCLLLFFILIQYVSLYKIPVSEDNVSVWKNPFLHILMIYIVLASGSLKFVFQWRIEFIGRRRR